MGVLEQVTQMRRENRSDEEIISALRNQGASPKEINDALNHAQIKNAVSDIMGEEPPAPAPGEYENQDLGMSSQQYPQQMQQQYPREQVYTPQPQSYPPQQGYEQQDYSSSYGQDYYAPQTNADTMVDVASQVFEEKISAISKKTEAFEEFRTITNAKLEHLNERLKRIEMLIDKLESAILEKIGAYGSNIESIRKEMGMMQDSFGKVVGMKAEKRGESENKESRKRK